MTTVPFSPSLSSIKWSLCHDVYSSRHNLRQSKDESHASFKQRPTRVQLTTSRQDSSDRTCCRISRGRESSLVGRYVTEGRNGNSPTGVGGICGVDAEDPGADGTTGAPGWVAISGISVDPFVSLRPLVISLAELNMSCERCNACGRQLMGKWVVCSADVYTRRWLFKKFQHEWPRWQLLLVGKTGNVLLG